MFDSYDGKFGLSYFLSMDISSELGIFVHIIPSVDVVAATVGSIINDVVFNFPNISAWF